MHELLFHRQKALEDGDLRGYAAQLGLDVAAFDRDRASTAVADRIRRDAGSGLASGQVLGTPTLFIDGVVHRGGYDPPALLAALVAESLATITALSLIAFGAEFASAWLSLVAALETADRDSARRR